MRNTIIGLMAFLVALAATSEAEGYTLDVVYRIDGTCYRASDTSRGVTITPPNFTYPEDMLWPLDGVQVRFEVTALPNGMSAGEWSYNSDPWAQVQAGSTTGQRGTVFTDTLTTYHFPPYLVVDIDLVSYSISLDSDQIGTYQLSQEDRVIEFVPPKKEGQSLERMIVLGQAQGTPTATIDGKLTIPAGTYGNLFMTGDFTNNVYTLTLDGRRSFTDTQTKKITYGEPYGELPVLELTGYTMEGWHRNIVPQVDDRVDADTVVSQAGDHILYANWVANTYTTTFEVGKAEWDEARTKVCTYGVEWSIPATVPVSGDRQFLGWRMDADHLYQPGDVVSNLTAEPNGSVSLVAVWKYPISSDIAGGEGVYVDQVFEVSAPVYISPVANDAYNRNATGWYAGLSLSWGESIYKSSDTTASVAGPHPVDAYTVHTLASGDLSPAGSGLKFKFKVAESASCMEDGTWWAYITPEDAFALNGEDYRAVLTLATDGKGTETFEIKIPTENLKLTDADGIAWFPAVALVNEKVYGDIDVALEAGGEIVLVRAVEVKADHELKGGTVLKTDGNEIFSAGGTIVADVGAKFDFDPTYSNVISIDPSLYKVELGEDGLYVVRYAHVCVWNYAGDGTEKLTATCQGEGTCHHGGTLVVELHASEKDYDGGVAEVSCTVPENFTEATGLSVGEIKYWQSGVMLAAAPKYAGEYQARVSVGEFCLVKDFAIAKPAGGYTDGYEVLSNGVRYDSFAEAASVAQEGDTIFCREALNQALIDFSSDQDIAVDLCGRTLTYQKPFQITEDNGVTDLSLQNLGYGTVTLKNGTIDQPVGYVSLIKDFKQVNVIGDFVFGQGIVALSEADLDDDALKVTSTAGGLSVTDGNYQCAFAANGGSVTITGGVYLKEYRCIPDPDFIPSGYVCWARTVDDVDVYQVELLEQSDAVAMVQGAGEVVPAAFMTADEAIERVRELESSGTYPIAAVALKLVENAALDGATLTVRAETMITLTAVGSSFVGLGTEGVTSVEISGATIPADRTLAVKGTIEFNGVVKGTLDATAVEASTGGLVLSVDGIVVSDNKVSANRFAPPPIGYKIAEREQAGRFVYAFEASVTPVAPGEKIDCGTSEKATAFAAEVNGDESGAKRDAWLMAPDEVDVSGTPYKTYFSAVTEGQYVWFELNAAGSNAVAEAEYDAKTNILETVLAATTTGESAATLTIAAPIKGFYYCLGQAESLTNKVASVVQKLAGGEGSETTVEFDLWKWSANGFYKILVRPEPILQGDSEDNGSKTLQQLGPRIRFLPE